MSPPLIILPAFFFLVAFVLWLAATTWQQSRRLRLLTEFHARLIDRLGSLTEFSHFANSEVGRQILNSIAVDSTSPRDRILRAVEMGIVLVTLGMGLLFLGQYFEFDGRQAFTAVGVIGLSLGAGFLISSAVSFHLARSLGDRLSTK
jgi:hypothetical protein